MPGLDYSKSPSLAPKSEAHLGRTPPIMLPSPNRSPEPSFVGRSVSEGPPRRSAPTSGLRPVNPTPTRQSPVSFGDEDDAQSQETTESIREAQIDEAVDQVPFDLARAVVNMQEYYASELEAERERTELLAAQNVKMSQKMEELENRLQMHVVLMDGFVHFMRDVKEGKFAVGTQAIHAETEIAQHLGHDHLEEVHALATRSSSETQIIHPSVEQPRPSEQISYYEDALPQEETVQTSWISVPEANFDLLPPTPDMYTAPVRSTGRRAPKRRNPPARVRREVKRRLRAESPPRTRTREVSTWTPINPRSDHGTLELPSADFTSEPTRTIGLRPRQPNTAPIPEDGDTEIVPEQAEDDGDFDYDPDFDEDPEDEPSIPADSRSSSPSLSAVSTIDYANLPKPRYSVPRSVGYRYATGPPGRRFKYHRMPKSVALVWKEWKHGSHNNPPIEELEQKYGTAWRMGTLQERKYASNYVGVRQKIVRKVEEMCEEQGIEVEDACRLLDERIDGRIQLLMTALRKGEDPLAVIPTRSKTSS
ncbi:high-osmolarity-induced transcription 1 [Fusarium albosuccineum]|uniref:High-osmolarity-induced transcription 1 n=1 Tax=Fusarium albosuccineum TaxID=1237068 RepID=A0A8H4LPA8_9HYPO|nr:high-osmolarity-induced transcription 1 [Fusarium albosuccineum]